MSGSYYLRALPGGKEVLAPHTLRDFFIRNMITPDRQIRQEDDNHTQKEWKMEESSENQRKQKGLKHQEQARDAQ